MPWHFKTSHFRIFFCLLFHLFEKFLRIDYYFLMSKSKIFLYFLLSFIGGIFVSSLFDVPKLIIYEFFILGIFYSLIFSREKTIVIFAICLIILGLGLLKTEITKLSEARPLTDHESQEYFFSLKQRFREVISQNFSPPQSSILAAILLGDKGKISQEWKEKLNIAGVRHITAVSGMHIVILSQILIWLAIFLGFYRGQAFWFAIIFLWLFILLVGFQPSAIRAGIMGSLVLFCQKLGRQKAALNTLVLAAVIMLAIDPLLLRQSVGFQLSFLATLGIIYLTPIFANLLQKIKTFKDLNLSSLLGMTFGALTFTLPVLIYNFGYLSLVTPLTNILIIPFLPYLMGLGFCFLLLGAIWQPIGWFLSLPVWLLATYLIKIVEFFSQVSWASKTLKISWIWLPIYYLILFFLTWRFTRKPRLKFLNF